MSVIDLFKSYRMQFLVLEVVAQGLSYGFPKIASKKTVFVWWGGLVVSEEAE